MSILGEWVARDLRTRLYEHLQRLSLAFFSRKKTGSLITRVTADTDRLWEFLAFGVVDVSLSLVMLLGLGLVLVTLDWRLGLVMVVPVPVFCWLIFLHGETINRLFLRAWRKVVESDRRAVGLDSRNPGGQGFPPGATGSGTVHGTERRRDR